MGCKPYHHQRIRYPSNDVEISFERKREVVEDSAERVDGHEEERYSDDLLVLVDLVVLWSIPSCSQQRGWTYLYVDVTGLTADRMRSARC